MMSNITFVCEKTGKNRTLQKEDTLLAKGSIGEVEILVSNDKESGLVCKTIRLGTAPNRKITLVRAVNELKFLRKAGLLEGYQRNNDEINIIIKKINGFVASKWTNLSTDHIPLFIKELRNTNGKGIVHSDTHLGNFIVSDPTTNPKVHLIDNDLAHDATYIGITIEHFMFLGTLNNKKLDITFNEYLNYYAQEMLEHVKNHRYQTCQNLLLIGALTLAAIYGVPALAITHLLVREFIYALLWDRFRKEISGFLDFTSRALLVAADKQDPAIPHRVNYKTILEITQVLNLTLISYLSYSQFAYHLAAGGSVGGKAILNAIKDRSWQNIFTNVTPEILTHTALLYYPTERLLNSLSKFSTSSLMPESVLKTKADLFYKYHPKFYAMQIWDKAKKKVVGNTDLSTNTAKCSGL